MAVPLQQNQARWPRRLPWTTWIGLVLVPPLVGGMILLEWLSFWQLLALPPLLALTMAAILAMRERDSAQKTPPATRVRIDPLHPTRLSQTLSRRRDAAGDRLEGRLVIEWLGGQVQQSLHIPFVPAFVEVPEVTCASQGTSEPEVRARVAEVRRFGARIELRRGSGNDQPASTPLTLVAELVSPDAGQAA